MTFDNLCSGNRSTDKGMVHSQKMGGIFIYSLGGSTSSGSTVTVEEIVNLPRLRMIPPSTRSRDREIQSRILD